LNRRQFNKTLSLLPFANIEESPQRFTLKVFNKIKYTSKEVLFNLNHLRSKTMDEACISWISYLRLCEGSRTHPDDEFPLDETWDYLLIRQSEINKFPYKPKQKIYWLPDKTIDNYNIRLNYILFSKYLFYAFLYKEIETWELQGNLTVYPNRIEKSYVRYVYRRGNDYRNHA